MTHIAPARFKTKKALKEAIESGASVFLNDPSVFDPVSGQYDHILETMEARGRSSFVVTNHPKRSWFAEVTRNRDGKIVVR